jgi:hypothetical protein
MAVLLSGGCTTVAVRPGMVGLDQTRAFAHADLAVWYDYAVQDGRLVYLVIDAVPPERQEPALLGLLEVGGRAVLRGDALVERGPGVAGARDGILLLRYADGRIVASRVDAAAAGKYVLAHRYQIAESTRQVVRGPLSGRVEKTQIEPASSNDEAHGLNLLGTLCGSAVFRDDAAFRGLARALAPVAEATALADDDP